MGRPNQCQKNVDANEDLEARGWWDIRAHEELRILGRRQIAFHAQVAERDEDSEAGSNSAP